MPAAAKPATVKKPKSVADLAAWVVENSFLFNDAATPFRAATDHGHPRLVVVTGENASGKSLFVRIVATKLSLDGEKKGDAVLPISVSIRERSGAGAHDLGGMRKAMMFGDEQEQSTGATSVKVVEAAFRNLDRPHGSVLILDEPELGLSEAYARALGEFIGSQSKTVPAKCLGVVVVTHSRPLVRGVIEGLGKIPTHAATAAEQPAQPGLNNWLEDVEHRSVEQLLALRDSGHDRWLRVLHLLKGKD